MARGSWGAGVLRGLYMVVRIEKIFRIRSKKLFYTDYPYYYESGARKGRGHQSKLIRCGTDGAAPCYSVLLLPLTQRRY